MKLPEHHSSEQPPKTMGYIQPTNILISVATICMLSESLVCLDSNQNSFTGPFLKRCSAYPALR